MESKLQIFPLPIYTFYCKVKIVAQKSMLTSQSSVTHNVE